MAIRKLVMKAVLEPCRDNILLVRARFSPTRGVRAKEKPVPKMMNAFRTLFTKDAAKLIDYDRQGKFEKK